MERVKIRDGKRTTPRRTMIYGPGGIGKSTFGSMAPGAVFLPTEEGLDDIACHDLGLSTNLDEYLANLSWLYEEPHDYRTAVTDSLDWLERLIHKEVCKQRSVENIDDIGYGKGYAFALPIWHSILDGFSALQKERGMAIICIAHSKIEKFDDPENESYDRYSPRLHKTSCSVLTEWFDDVLFANYKAFTTKSDEGFGKKKVKGVGGGERVIYTTTKPAHVAKNRLNLPDEIPLDWDAYAGYFAKAS